MKTQIISIAKGYATKCKTGICIDPLGMQYYDKATKKMIGNFSNKKPKSQYYLIVILTDYIEGGNRLQITKYYSQVGKLLYSTNCTTKKCNKEEEFTIKKLLNEMQKHGDS